MTATDIFSSEETTVMENDNSMMMDNEQQYEALCKTEQDYMSANDYLSRLSEIDTECRQATIAWFYHVADYCRLEGETVEISVNYLDRFLSNEDMVKSDLTLDDFQLIALTCLYVAVKVHESVSMKPAVIASLSGAQVLPEDIVACEQQLLQGLGWRMNPPTAMSFVRLTMSFNNLPPVAEHQVVKLCKMQLEGALLDYFSMVTVRPSVLAAAAVSNSLIGYDESDESLRTCSLANFVDLRVADNLARAIPDDALLPVSPQSCASQRKSSAKYEASRGGDVSPKCVAEAHPR